MSPSEQKINEVGRHAQENANLIWNAANSLFGAFKPHEYGLVILPMCVIKRFHDCLLPTRDAVLEANKQYASFGELKVGFLREAADSSPIRKISRIIFEIILRVFPIMCSRFSLA